MIQKRKYKTNTNLRDKYYTKKEVASKCIDVVNNIVKDVDIFLEPSAGAGSFSKQLENCLAFDISPACENVVKKDFFKVNRDDIGDGNICCIGNPPFGRNSSLAIKFFNHASLFSKYIAFIIPKTFRKISVQNKLNSNFHLAYDADIPKNSFEKKVNKTFESVDVPCVFQIWEFREEKREVVKAKLKSKLFDFVSKEECDFAVRRVGGRTGKVFDDNIEELSVQSNYFIRGNIDPNLLKSVISSINFSQVINSTAGVRSLSKNELIYYVEERINDSKLNNRR